MCVKWNTSFIFLKHSFPEFFDQFQSELALRPATCIAVTSSPSSWEFPLLLSYVDLCILDQMSSYFLIYFLDWTSINFLRGTLDITFERSHIIENIFFLLLGSTQVLSMGTPYIHIFTFELIHRKILWFSCLEGYALLPVFEKQSQGIFHLFAETLFLCWDWYFICFMCI